MRLAQPYEFTIASVPIRPASNAEFESPDNILNTLSDVRAGMILEVRVYKPGQVGKYTRLSIRRGKGPKRDDKCLAPEGVRPITCPSS